ncbi:SDR family NAD(P)-dependent oxidoreductase [Psychromarinibacter halotolerans]
MTTTRTAIVTGASRGIGAEIARTLAADGWAVAVNFARNATAAEAVVSDINAAGGRAVAVQADLSQAAGATALFDDAEAALGPAGALVNNAGVMSLNRILETDDASLDAHIATNLAGPFRLMREAARRMPDGGRIVNLSSSVVGLYQPGYAAYAATKAGIEAVTKILSKEIGAAWHHRECRGARPGCHRPVHGRQKRRDRGPDPQHDPAWPTGRTGRHRKGGPVFDQRRRWVDQRPDAARQWRRCLTVRGMAGAETRRALAIAGRSGGTGHPATA